MNEHHDAHQAQQSTDVDRTLLVSYRAYCSECPGGWQGSCYDSRQDSTRDAQNHNNTYHAGTTGATVIESSGSC